MLIALIAFPLAMGLVMLLFGRALLCRLLLPLTAIGHSALTAGIAWQIAQGATPRALDGMLAPDALGVLFLSLASILFLIVSFYAVSYLREEERIGIHTNILLDHGQFTNQPERRFAAFLCFFLASMSLVTITPHMGVQWVSIEATTLSSAPLIYFHRHKSSLEATWKYLIICSVGIALALLGNILLSVAFYSPTVQPDEGFDQVSWFIAHAGSADPTWLKAAFVFLLAGYGTKMGLAPLHNWLPDAHSQAPSLVSALLSGALLNCAMLGLLRGHQIMQAAHLGEVSSQMLIFLGVVSLVTAAIFIVGQGHYKRLLAYSSVEHMGILAIGIGVGGVACQGAMLHAVVHSFTKCLLFLLSGNILARYHTYSSYDVRGLRWTMPITGALWTAGFFAIAGSPPFGLFVSEMLILKGILAKGSIALAVAYLVLLAIIFVGLSVACLRMVQGNRPLDMPKTPKEPWLSVLPPMVLALTVLALGLYIPEPLWNFLLRAQALIG
ncbi:MAG: NADH dehydrogenase FAD-containing subunit [Desulfovibrionaceae bacterium]|nr:NADH dehydrogenase FAD-containing subunit [Desulfovibrionaceae bacterium]